MMTMNEDNQTKEYIQQGTRAFKKANLALFAAAFITFANLYMTQPIMPVFTKEFDVTPTMASLSLSLTTLSLAFGLLIFGSLSESWGRKNIMSVSIIITSVLTVIIAFSPTFELHLILRVIQGIAFAGIPSIAMAYLGEEIEGNSVGAAMGLYIGGNTVGGLSGRVIMGTMTDLFSWQTGMVFLGVISLIAGIYFIWALPPSKHFHPQPLKLKSLFGTLVSHLKSPVLVSLFLIAFFLMGGFVTIYNYLGFKLAEPPYLLSMTIIGWMFIVYLVGTFSSAWFGVLGDKFGRPLFIILGAMLMLLGVVLTLPVSLFYKIIGIIVLTFGFFGAHSVASGLVSRHATHDIAQASSLYLFAYYMGSSFGGSAGGIFWSRYGWLGVVSFTIGLLIVSVFLALKVKKLSGRNTADV
ncbi:MFS transporter [Siminovitchia fortis]|uniref:MFS transporter n=1 Tax=Siminovitchia fortis TaxID=254758 RepID=A0A443IQV1_9BACI|nr:MFS transporter [Siminovitchia fortis]RWR09278.1 MFS transporter [Siminovitchia fortis]WHY80889.1 MFS transporter [Siminovitchia fortis]